MDERDRAQRKKEREGRDMETRADQRERVPNKRKKNTIIDRERKRGGSEYKVREKLWSGF